MREAAASLVLIVTASTGWAHHSSQHSYDEGYGMGQAFLQKVPGAVRWLYIILIVNPFKE
jgi:hypothetical protein